MSQKVGRVRTCQMQPGALSKAEEWLNHQRLEWEKRLDRLAEYLRETKDD
jgi:hypothetical protein